MQNARKSILIGFSLSIALSGCQAFSEIGGAEPVTAVSVGNNLLGESCRILPSAAEQGQPKDFEGYRIFCGNWEEPSAFLFKTGRPMDHAALAHGGWWRERLNSFALCAAPKPTSISTGATATALDCAFKTGGWTYQGLVADSSGHSYLGDGIPAAAPALERGIAALSGQSFEPDATVDASLSGEIARLEAKLSANYYSAGDLIAYLNLLDLARYYNLAGEFAEAEARYRQALRLQQERAVANNDAMAFVLMHLALELSNQERFDEAETLFKRTERLVGGSFDPTLEARLLSYEALHNANLGEHDAATRLAQSASRKRLEIASIARPEIVARIEPDAVVLAGDTGLLFAGNSESALANVVQSKHVEAAMLIREGKIDEAERVLGDALLVLDAEPGVPRSWVPQVQILLAEISERRGHYAEAERRLVEAIQAQGKLFVDSRTEGLAYLYLGRVRAEANRNTAALAAFRSGFDILAKDQGGVLFRDARPFFHLALAEANSHPDQRQALMTEMFEAGQLVRGPLTAQTLALTTARLAASDQEAGRAIRSLQDAQRERDELNETIIFAQADPGTLAPQLEALQKKWLLLTERIAELERQVQAAAPRYNQLVDAPVKAAVVAEVLKADEAIAQVLVGDETSFGFYVDAKGIEAYEIPLKGSEAKHTVDVLRQPFDQAKFIPYDVFKAYALYHRLFGPVEGRLQEAKHVITVPSGPLMSLPFGVLVTEAPIKANETDYTQVNWMARRHALTLAPSVQSFVNLRETVKPSLASQPMIGFGAFLPNQDVEAVAASRGLSEACRKDAVSVASAPALPGTADELEAVAGLLNASRDSLVLGAAFTESAVKDAHLDDYRVVYFATHGLLPHDFKCWSEPSLLASYPVASPDRADDGLLEASEIIDLKLDADLVVLSACNTGGPGQETGGESLSGLARSFFYAGARSMLVTHWQIPDKPTLELMESTFKSYSQSGRAGAEALRQGQLALMSSTDRAHPLNWGAFTLVGDGGTRFSTAPQIAMRP